MRKGIGLSVGASVLFAVLYYYATLLKPLEGTEIFAWRVVLGVPALALVITRLKRWSEVLLVLKRMLRDFRYLLLQLACSVLFGVQLWLFVWAPLHQKALDVSMGYFLLPLMMVLAGRLIYKEKLSTMQWIAVTFASLGVLHELLQSYSFSWATALVVFGYPPYFVLRRFLNVGSLTSLFFDFGFLLIPAAYILLSQEVSFVQQFGENWSLYWKVLLFGIISSAALLGYLTASRLLPLGLFGILGYVEPVLLFWVAFLLLGEPVQAHDWFTYIPIWIAVLLVATEGFIAWRKSAAKGNR
ncbi:EamA family transporter RarD [Paenalcaligenes niemegkensis]|uniref:EamA family transporter RarD n=1 Tax=Paenalcaligenes niemegkensis TaxID=2895469 RepID=UPI001EE8FD70|nr:EamA family transporter RarD [Paenalcaligenes niemegkensis]MCQ9616875.1 EamA family transporter RarD [Paenalcaligenes niemegkensis]